MCLSMHFIFWRQPNKKENWVDRGGGRGGDDWEWLCGEGSSNGSCYGDEIDWLMFCVINNRIAVYTINFIM